MHDVILASEIERERGRDAAEDQVPDARSGNLRDDLTDLAIWWPVLSLCPTEMQSGAAGGSVCD